MTKQIVIWKQTKPISMHLFIKALKTTHDDRDQCQTMMKLTEISKIFT